MNDDVPAQPDIPRQIAHPKVIMVSFENQGGDWVVRIDDGSDKLLAVPIEDNLILQFQPVKMTSIMRAQKTIGVGCLVLEKVYDDEERSEPDAQPEPTT